MKLAMNSLSALIIKLQGDGDLDGVKKLIAEKGLIHAELQKDLDKLKAKNIPVDLVFEQGIHTLELESNTNMPVTPNNILPVQMPTETK
jgi:hypothetical protein